MRENIVLAVLLLTCFTCGFVYGNMKAEKETLRWVIEQLEAKCEATP